MKYKRWTLTSNKDETQKVYQSAKSRTSVCDCPLCENYEANKEHIYPEEIKQLFSGLGIDYTKSGEVWDGNFKRKARGKPRMLECSVWFHFKGSFKGKDSGFFNDLEEVNESCHIGFSNRVDSDHSFFKNPKGVVQVMVNILVPWTIGEEKRKELINSWIPILKG